VLGVVFEFALKVGDAQDAKLILAINVPHEVEEGRLAQALLDQADNLAAAVVRSRGEVDELAVLGHVLHARMGLAARPGADHAEVAKIVAANVREPAQPLRIVEQLVVLAHGAVGQAMAEVGRQPFVHPGLGVAVGADGVVPPLMRQLVLQEIGWILLGDVRHVEDAVVDHHEPAAFVAGPAEAAFDDRELRIRITPEPLVVDGQRFGRGLDEHLRIKGVLRRRQAADAYAVRLAGPFLEASARGQREVAHADRIELNLLPAVAEIGFLAHGTGRRELVIARQLHACGVDAGIVEERLMPRNERRRLPARVVVDRDDGEPLGERGDALPLAPATFFLR
jgi:hypothetical protein